MKKLIGMMMVIGLACGVVHFLATTAKNTQSEEIVFTVAPGDDALTIAKNLAAQGLAPSRWSVVYHVLTQGARGKIKAGDYSIMPGAHVSQTVQQMAAGDTVVKFKESVDVTFPEGWTSKQMAERLTKKGFPGATFAELVAAPSSALRTQYPFLAETETLEGYLFPDTYTFDVDAGAEDIVQKMLTNFDRRVSVETRTQGAALFDDSFHQFLTFASIVEGEVPEDGDRALVAGIFQNRLEIGQRLESDATIDFITGVPEIKHTLDDLQVVSPYNTYKNAGLPPGPINSPSIESIEAALAPAETPYFFFLNNPETGKTVFAETYDEHLRNMDANGL